MEVLSLHQIFRNVNTPFQPGRVPHLAIPQIALSLVLESRPLAVVQTLAVPPLRQPCAAFRFEYLRTCDDSLVPEANLQVLYSCSHGILMYISLSSGHMLLAYHCGVGNPAMKIHGGWSPRQLLRLQLQIALKFHKTNGIQEKPICAIIAAETCSKHSAL